MLPRWVHVAWVVPGAFLVAFLAWPLMRLVSEVWQPSVLGNLVDAGTWQIAGLAVVQAAVSTALAIVAGLPIANVVSRYRFAGRPFVQALVTVPFVLPTVVVALAIRSVIGTGVGQGFAAVVTAHAYVNIAVVVRIVGSRWSQHDARYETVARTLGASPLRTFTSVTWPMIRSSVLSSAAIVFVFCFTSLGIVLLLGDASTRTLESQILRQASLLLDFPGAVATAIVQLVVVTAILLAAARIGTRGPTERLLPAHELRLPRSTTGRLAVLATAVFAAALVLVPIVALVRASLVGSGGLTLDFWRSIGDVDAGTTRLGTPLGALTTSLTFAAITAVVAGLVGGMAAIATLAHGVGRAVAVVALLPLGISAATLGLGTLLAFGRPPLDLRASGLLVPMAHALVAVPLVVAVAMPALRAADRRVLVVAATLGASTQRAFWTAYGPILRVVMVAAAGLAAAVSLGEFGAAAFLTRAGSPTVPVQIVRLLGRPGETSYGVAAALSVILVVLTLVLVLGVDRMGRKQRMVTA